LVTIDFDFANVGDSFLLETPTETLGTFAYDDLPLRIEVPLSGLNGELLRVIDSQNSDCERADDFEVDCNNNNCEIGPLSFDNIECITDSTYLVTINFDFANVGDSFQLETRSETLGTFAYDDLPLRIDVPLSGLNQELLRVIDNQNNACERADEFEVDCNNNNCEIGPLSFDNIECITDSTYLVTVDFDFANVSDSFHLETRTETLGTFAYSDLPLRIEVPLSGLNGELLRVIDSQNNDCERADDFEVDCNNNNCEIGPLSFENIECITDSTYLVTIDFDFGNTSDSFQLETRTETLGTFAYNDLPLRIEVPLSGLNDELLRVIDNLYNDCERADEFEVDCNPSSVFLPNTFNLEVYPNPASEFIYLRTKAPLSGTYLLLNMSSSTVSSGQISSSRSIPIQSLSTGFYVLRLELRSGRWINKKVLIH
jgi:hypothetical protein